MKSYHVTINRLEVRSFEVYADSPAHATRIADDAYANYNFDAGALIVREYAIEHVQETEGAPPSAASIP